MAKNTGFDATRGIVPGNKGGTHGGIDPAGGHVQDDVPSQGSSGNPGTQFPWDGSDATDIGANTALPPLRSL